MNGGYLALEELSNATVIVIPPDLRGLLGSSVFNFLVILFISALFAELLPGRRLLKITAFFLSAYTLSFLVFVQGRAIHDALVVIAVAVLALIDAALKILAAKGVAVKAAAATAQSRRGVGA